MKKIEIGTKIIVSLGKKFGNARIIATYDGKHEEDSSVVKPLEVTCIKDSYKFIVNTILKTRLIISDNQILSKY